MTCATFAAALWLYLSTVFGLPVSITHTVIGSIVGFAVYSSGGFAMVKARGLGIIVVSWVTAPLAALIVTAALFSYIRRDIFKVKGRSFELALRALPYCLAASLFVDYFFILIEKPPIMTKTLAVYVPLWLQFVILFFGVLLVCFLAQWIVFPVVAARAMEQSSFMWESAAVRTEVKVDESEKSAVVNASFVMAKDSVPAAPKQTPGEGDFLNTPRMRAATPMRPATPMQLQTSSSLMLSSIDASDRHMRTAGSVRLAPVGRPKTRDPSVSSYRHSEIPESEPNEKSLLSALPSFRKGEQSADYGATAPAEELTALFSSTYVSATQHSPVTVESTHEFGDEDWQMDHPMEPINFGGILIKPFNPRAEYLFTGLQVVAGSMSSFVHGAVAGANATATFVILYEAFTNHELGEANLSASWSVLPAMLGIAIGMFGLGASLMKTVGVELVTVTPARGWCIQVGGTLVTMILTGIGIPVSLSQSQVGAAIGCGVLDAKWKGVSWSIVIKIISGWVITLVVSALTTAFAIMCLSWYLC
ncbi:solute carrier family 20 (sodium-dependent phosphate transporter) [Angomonas deanei]|uniref:Phosphate transporter n=1 Tax=Angomonas deanei TaxID=59799 RepID=S9VT91_9TRYP|nr:solute carrier family 20 (sodium-dependent phosphate transporter) [Angomonas deanei]EPY32417.1 solute carrier family 20 (sodium-dependent phosphate transporter) [Angomonas deanei]CAD2213378.1 Phosphate transporter family, putative [Angomonas deanei]|eukprot:EPY26470.1 solute carrier family 20 (sodium-dependent phosphate transporter) [Angomonas deanei]